MKTFTSIKWAPLLGLFFLGIVGCDDENLEASTSSNLSEPFPSDVLQLEHKLELLKFHSFSLNPSEDVSDNYAPRAQTAQDPYEMYFYDETADQPAPGWVNADGNTWYVRRPGFSLSNYYYGSNGTTVWNSVPTFTDSQVEALLIPTTTGVAGDVLGRISSDYQSYYMAELGNGSLSLWKKTASGFSLLDSKPVTYYTYQHYFLVLQMIGPNIYAILADIYGYMIDYVDATDTSLSYGKTGLRAVGSPSWVYYIAAAGSGGAD